MIKISNATIVFFCLFVCVCICISNRGIRSTNETASTIVDFQPAVITGLRVEEVDKGVSYEDGVSIVLAGATVSVFL